MRSLVLGAGLTAALVAASLAGSPAPAAASSLDIAWTEGHPGWPGWHGYGWPGWRPYGWPPRPAWDGPWWPRHAGPGPWWTGVARVDTVRRELTGDDLRLRNDQLDRRLGHGEAAAFRAEDSAIRAEANRDAAPFGGLSYDAFLRLQAEVNALSARISRADGTPVA